MEFKYLSVFLKVGLFSIIFFVLSACNNGGSSGVPGVQPADTPPQVTRTTPATNATDGVPGIITVVFSEDVIGVNDNTFLVRQAGAATNLTGVVTYDNASRTATFTNKSDNLMLFNTSYTVTLKSDVILDDSDKPLDSGQTTTDYIFTFNTGVTPIVDISAKLPGDVTQHYITVGNIAMGKTSRAASVWRQQDSNNVRIYASLFENGKWQKATTLVDIPFVAATNDVSLKGLVSNGDGFAVQWSRDDSSTMLTHNYVSIYTDDVGGGGNWTGQESAINTGAGDASELLLATNGNAYVTVWTQPGMIRSRFNSANTWSAIIDVAPASFSADELQLTSNGSGYGLAWLDEGINTDALGNEDIVDVVYFDFYDGNWSMQPTRVSLPPTKPGGGVEREGNLEFSYRPRLSFYDKYYALTWYGQDVSDISRIFSSVMVGVVVNTGAIKWNGPLRLSTLGNPSNNIIVSSGDGYLVTWDAYQVGELADSFIYYSPFVLDPTFPGLGDWYPQQGPANDTSLGTAASPLPFGTSRGYAVVWTQTGAGENDGDVYGRVYLNGAWQDGTKLSHSGLGAKSGLTINGRGNQFIASWVQGQDKLPGKNAPPGIAYVNRYDGTTWEIDATDPMNPLPVPVELEDPLTVTTASSNVKTVPLGNGHYMATWLKEVTLGGVKRLDSKFVQAP